MNGVLAILYELENPVETPDTRRYFQSGPRNEPERANPGDIRQTEVLEWFVVRDV